MTTAELLDEVRRNIHGALSDYRKGQENGCGGSIVDYFLLRCLSFYERPAESMATLRQKNGTKMKGDIFEAFGVLYFQYVCGLVDVWMLRDCPFSVLQKLKLRRADVGIDLIGRDKFGGYHAIQAKYRKRNTRYKSKIVLSWKQLSTFFAIVSRTGPFVRHWVFTNADYCRRFGRRTPEDRSICYQGLCGIRTDQWLEMAGSVGRKIDESDGGSDEGSDVMEISNVKKGLTFKKPKVLTPEEIRERRLAFFLRQSIDEK